MQLVLPPAFFYVLHLVNKIYEVANIISPATAEN